MSGCGGSIRRSKPRSRPAKSPVPSRSSRRMVLSSTTRPFGYADIATSKPMETTSIFRIASMTKAITSAGVMILYERGHFMLNDPVSDYLPMFADPECRRRISTMTETSRRRGPPAARYGSSTCLTHTSGITYAFIDQPLKPTYDRNGVIDGFTASQVTLAEVMGRLAEQPLLFDPGERFGYGLNTDVLGYLIEVVSGMPLDEFFRTEIFEPLGMQDTYFYIPDEKADRLVTLYAEVDGVNFAYPTAQKAASNSTIRAIRSRVRRSYFSGGAGFRRRPTITSVSYRCLKTKASCTDGACWVANPLSCIAFATTRTGERQERESRFRRDSTTSGRLVNWAQKALTPGAAHSIRPTGSIPKEDLVAVIMTQVRPTTSDITRRYQTLVYQALE